MRRDEDELLQNARAGIPRLKGRFCDIGEGRRARLKGQGRSTSEPESAYGCTNMLSEAGVAKPQNPEPLQQTLLKPKPPKPLKPKPLNHKLAPDCPKP